MATASLPDRYMSFSCQMIGLEPTGAESAQDNCEVNSPMLRASAIGNSISWRRRRRIYERHFDGKIGLSARATNKECPVYYIQLPPLTLISWPVM
jgi:hypothetical protein